jgi:hypothetical protein
MCLALALKPVVLILDALDECGNSKSHKILLSILATQFIRLPFFIIITSRTEYDIMQVFQAQPHILECELDLAVPNNVEDIGLYIRSCLKAIRKDNMLLLLLSGWLGEESSSALAAHATGH